MLSLNANGSFTYTPFANFSGEDLFTYRAGDGAAQSATATVRITVNAVNDAPTSIELSNAAIAERTNTTSAVTVGLLSASDVDGSSGHVFSLVTGTGGTDNATFQISGNQLQVKAGTVLDFERQSSYSVRVRVSDGGLTFERVFTINVTNVQEVALDVNPGDNTDTIDLRTDSRVSVAILSTATFNATTGVVLESLTFGRLGTENSLARNKKGAILYSHQDVNGDGRLDLVVQFDTAKTGLQVGNTEATLRGALMDGSLFAQSTPVQVISSSKGGRGNSRGTSVAASSEFATLDAFYGDESNYDSILSVKPRKA